MPEAPFVPHQIRLNFAKSYWHKTVIVWVPWKFIHPLNLQADAYTLTLFCSPPLPWYQLGLEVCFIREDLLPVCLPSSLLRTLSTFSKQRRTYNEWLQPHMLKTSPTHLNPHMLSYAHTTHISNWHHPTNSNIHSCQKWEMQTLVWLFLETCWKSTSRKLGLTKLPTKMSYFCKNILLVLLFGNLLVCYEQAKNN